MFHNIRLNKNECYQIINKLDIVHNILKFANINNIFVENIRNLFVIISKRLLLMSKYKIS